MKKILPFKIMEGNMGAQYHHYLLGVILSKPQSSGYIYNNYMGMEVKHFSDSHVDFCFDGIYACSPTVLRQFMIRGPIAHLHENIIQCIHENAYVVLNVNEQNLPNRGAYNNGYFRHDLIIYGYDDEERVYTTAGFDENMNFGEWQHGFDEVEQAYRTMLNEWDYELFVFQWNEDCRIEINVSKIGQDLECYLQGKNQNERGLQRFLQGNSDCFFVNESYKQYYGIRVYDYLVDRMKEQHRLFQKESDREGMGVNDIRSLNAIYYHVEIMIQMLQERFTLEEVQEQVTKLQDLKTSLYAAKLLLLKYIHDPSKKNGKKFIAYFSPLKEQEKEIVEEMVQKLR